MTVMIPTRPQFIKKKQIGSLVLLQIYIAVNCVCNAGRVEDNAVRIFQHFEFMLLQTVADMIGKATSHQHYTIADI